MVRICTTLPQIPLFQITNTNAFGFGLYALEAFFVGICFPSNSLVWFIWMHAFIFRTCVWTFFSKKRTHRNIVLFHHVGSKKSDRDPKRSPCLVHRTNSHNLSVLYDRSISHKFARLSVSHRFSESFCIAPSLVIAQLCAIVLYRTNLRDRSVSHKFARSFCIAQFCTIVLYRVIVLFWNHIWLMLVSKVEREWLLQRMGKWRRSSGADLCTFVWSFFIDYSLSIFDLSETVEE